MPTFSVFKGLVQIFATSTKICNRNRLHPSWHPSHPCSPQLLSACCSFFLLATASFRRVYVRSTLRRSGIAPSLQRHSFPGTVDSAGELLHTHKRTLTSVTTILSINIRKIVDISVIFNKTKNTTECIRWSGGMTSVLDCDIVVSEFKLQSG